ncbi:hypothetical protein ACRQ5Q_21760 [Bradyrhizobium sp. PMVTL-01]|uniref:hypothetical protein n=1 Tax=Bradyrhizobium sp. PMVTL-01 TaxID=3434999 RepID=UPI003F6F2D69
MGALPLLLMSSSLRSEELPVNRELKEFLRLERTCREHAAIASFELEREGLLKVAEYYRKAIEALERRPTADSPRKFPLPARRGRPL